MDFKRGFLFGLGILAALTLVLAYAGNTNAINTGVSNSSSDGPAGVITVTGNGYVYGEPDIAKVCIGVVTEADTSSDAMSKNSKDMDAVISAIRKAGIPDKDIQTNYVSIQPVYDYSNQPRIAGYTATNTVTVTIRDMSIVGTVIDTAYASGSNRINGICFMMSEERYASLYKQALDKAVKDGSEKARTIAIASGGSDLELKRVSESEGYCYNPVPYYTSYDYRMVSGKVATTTPVSQGEDKVQATVSMEYTFR